VLSELCTTGTCEEKAVPRYQESVQLQSPKNENEAEATTGTARRIYLQWKRDSI